MLSDCNMRIPVVVRETPTTATVVPETRTTATDTHHSDSPASRRQARSTGRAASQENAPVRVSRTGIDTTAIGDGLFQSISICFF